MYLIVSVKYLYLLPIITFSTILMAWLEAEADKHRGLYDIVCYRHLELYRLITIGMPEIRSLSSINRYLGIANEKVQHLSGLQIIVEACKALKK